MAFRCLDKIGTFLERTWVQLIRSELALDERRLTPSLNTNDEASVEWPQVIQYLLPSKVLLHTKESMCKPQILH